MLDMPSLSQTADALVPFLYDDLRRIARRTRWQVSAGSTVQTTALVHEAYLKLRGSPGFADRQHFLRAAAMAMRHVLVDLARETLTAKRGSGADHVPLDDARGIEQPSAQLLVEVSEAVDRLRGVSERLAAVVECRFFAGYNDEEAADALGLSDRTVRRDWLKARAWLRRELDGSAVGSS
ncbi:MAG TPA: ECF-type sigma factor [Caldimonas sp.]|nr:ECF-type sigma factor [Caldimonas sp.]